jgi:hypothetical protein
MALQSLIIDLEHRAITTNGIENTAIHAGISPFSPNAVITLCAKCIGNARERRIEVLSFPFRDLMPPLSIQKIEAKIAKASICMIDEILDSQLILYFRLDSPTFSTMLMYFDIVQNDIPFGFAVILSILLNERSVGILSDSIVSSLPLAIKTFTFRRFQNPSDIEAESENIDDDISRSLLNSKIRTFDNSLVLFANDLA